MEAPVDGDLQNYLVAMESRIIAGQKALADRLDAVEARLDAVESRLMARLNNSEERILNRLEAMESDAQNTKGFLLNDAAIASRRWLDLERRVTKLEDDRA